MTLKQLEAFYWAATCASFSVAAQRIHISVSSLSKRISELEESFGCLLFDRVGRKAMLTPEGERLVPKARDLLHQADEVRRSLGERRGLRGKCRFGSGELSASTWLPALVARSRSLHPDLILEPHVDIGWALEQRVEEGELDFAIVARASSRSAIRSDTVGQTEFAWVVSPRLLPGGEPSAAELLREFLIISLPQGAGAARLLDEWSEYQNALAERRMTCNNLAAIIGLVVEGVGVTYLPHAWARALESRGDVRILNHLPALPALTYSFQWRRDDNRDLIRAMRELAHETIDFQAPHRML